MEKLFLIPFLFLFISNQRSTQYFLAIIFGILFSWYCFSLAQQELIQPFPAESVDLDGYVQIQEIRSSRQQRLTILVEQSSDKSIVGQKILVYTRRYPEVKKGESISVSCELEAPEAFEGFAYDRYLASQGIFYLCRKTIIHKQEKNELMTSQPLEFLRITIAREVESLWPRPQSSLVLGLLLGTRESFPTKTLLDFQRSGVTHIIALSGFNITILIVFLESMAIQFLIPKKVRLFLIVGGIIFFTVFVGAGASIVRASIMGSLVLIAKYSARCASPLRLMLITATAMSIASPFVLLYDLGFQLSFLSTFGLLYLTPLFEQLFRWVPKFASLQESLATTMAATTTTLPLILFQFEQLSLVSPIANMLILPLIPWLMALGGIAVLLSFIHPFFSSPFQWIVDLGCQYLLSVSQLMASFSWSSVQVRFSFSMMIISYMIIFILLIYAKSRQTPS